MRYLTVDGMFSGTGIRDSVAGGYIELRELHLSDELTDKIRNWVSRYASAHYIQYENKAQNQLLDQEGVVLCRQIQSEVTESKVEYYSSAELRKLIV